MVKNSLLQIVCSAYIFVYCKINTQLNTDSHNLNVVWWNLAWARDWGEACHCSSDCDTCLVWPAKLLSVSPSRFTSQCRRGTCSLSMRSTASLFSPLTVTLQYFSIPITRTVGDPLLLTALPATQVWLHVREQPHYAHNYTLLPTLLCQPFLLIHDPQKLRLQMCIHSSFIHSVMYRTWMHLHLQV